MYDNTIITNALNSFPEELRDAITSVRKTELILDIGERNGLHIDQTGRLADEADYLMLGLTKREEFVGVLQRELGVDEEKATAIARDVNDEILSEIRSALRERTEAPEESGKLESGIRNQSETTPPHPSPRLGEGDDSREALLREIESPTATPISGRMVRPEIGRSTEDGGRSTENEVRTTGDVVTTLTPTSVLLTPSATPVAPALPTITVEMPKAEQASQPIVQVPQPATPPAQTPPAKPASDPYRELPT